MASRWSSLGVLCWPPFAFVAGALAKTQPATAAKRERRTVVLAGGPRRLATSRAPARSPAMRFPYEPEPEWLMLPTTNHWYGRRGAVVENVVIHYTVITYEQTLRAFNTRSSDVSSHYVIRGDGHIAYVVGEEHTAWHSGNYLYNINSIGIELELNRRTNPVFREEQYLAAAAVTCRAAARWGFPLDRAHVIGHNEVPGATHTDPGPTWNWPHFMWLLSLVRHRMPRPSAPRRLADVETEIAADGVGDWSVVLAPRATPGVRELRGGRLRSAGTIIKLASSARAGCARSSCGADRGHRARAAKRR